tara:strand:+ start:1836 stop:1988 length:153 start_codon:yes stop_codon:yes gene_type:complete
MGRKYSGQFSRVATIKSANKPIAASSSGLSLNIISTTVDATIASLIASTV